MFRLLGFIIGSAASIVGIVFLLGVPEFHLSSFESDQARFDAAIEKIREKQPEALASSIAPEPPEPAVANETPNTPTQQGAEAATESSDPLMASASDEPIESIDADSLIAGEPIEWEGINDAIGLERQWYPFWNPFHSEIAARGFVNQLEKVTGLDYRVVKVKTGVYQVGFSYQDDADRQERLSQITAATGLELPE